MSDRDNHLGEQRYTLAFSDKGAAWPPPGGLGGPAARPGQAGDRASAPPSNPGPVFAAIAAYSAVAALLAFLAETETPKQVGTLAGTIIGPLIWVGVVAKVWCFFRKKRVRWTAVVGVSAVLLLLLVPAELGRATDRAEARALTAELLRLVANPSVPPDGGRADAPRSAARRVAAAMRDGRERLSALTEGVIDASVVGEALSPPSLARPEARAATVARVGGKLKLLNALPPQVQAVASDMRSRIAEVAEASTRPRTPSREVLLGVGNGAAKAALSVAALEQPIRTVYGDVLDLLFLLGRPEGAATLGVQGKLVFRDQAGLDDFRTLAARLDGDRKALDEALAGLEARQRDALARTEGWLSEAGHHR